MASQLWASHKRGEHSLYSFQYCDRLHDWGLWLQQLWSESLAKKISRDGQPAAAVATIVPCRGASDQHSVLQQVIEGNEKKFVCFHQVASSERSRVNIESSLFETSLLVGSGVGRLLQVQAEATEQAIRESQSGTMVLKTSELNEESLACLMMAWMLCIGVLGELLNIDAFNQPGVESGKVITRRVLSQPR